MNEFLRSFIMTGIRDMIKRNRALYQIYQYASGWFDKNVLTQEDLQEIARLCEERDKAEEQVEVKEETVENIEPIEEDKPVETIESEG